MGSDRHLKLAGAATQVLRGDSPHSAKIPENIAFPLRLFQNL